MSSDYSSAVVHTQAVSSAGRVMAIASRARSGGMRHPCHGMTSRTTPVGILVLALAGLFAVGCNAQTSAVVEALLDSAEAPASASVANTSGDAAQGSASGTWWPHPDGYAMDLPAGWFGIGVDRLQTTQLIDAAGSTLPGLAARMNAVLGSAALRVSGIAGDPTAIGPGPMLLVLAQPIEGRRPHEMKLDVKRQISQLPGLSVAPFIKDAGLPRTRGWRFDYSIEDVDLGALRVRSYLVTYGFDAYLVSFIAPEASVDDADALFDAIAESLRFGV
jgi:hypothetical protein